MGHLHLAELGSSLLQRKRDSCVVRQVHGCQGTKERQGPQVCQGRQTWFPKFETAGGTTEFRLQCTMGRDPESQGGQVRCLRRRNHAVVTAVAISGPLSRLILADALCNQCHLSCFKSSWGHIALGSMRIRNSRSASTLQEVQGRPWAT